MEWEQQGDNERQGHFNLKEIVAKYGTEREREEWEIDGQWWETDKAR